MRWLAILMLGWSGVLQAATLPRPDHIVIVVEENRAYEQIIGNKEAPYINALVKRGALYTRSYGITHPSQPNYLALFSGTTRGISSNACPLELSGGNLASSLVEQGLSWASYSESMPHAGYDDCVWGAYMRKHNPAANWKELAAYNLPYTAFPQDFSKLPTVALLVPDQRHDMHDGSIAQGDEWLKQNLSAYIEWAMSHNSLLVLTWDEDDGAHENHIATLWLGPMVKSGRYAQRVDHYDVLHTIEAMYGLPHLNESTHARVLPGLLK